MGLFAKLVAIAGTKVLVMSLWKVPDLATALLMEQFFDNIQNGIDHIQALRNAQNHIRNITVEELRNYQIQFLHCKCVYFGEKVNCLEKLLSQSKNLVDNKFTDWIFSLPTTWEVP